MMKSFSPGRIWPPTFGHNQYVLTEQSLPRAIVGLDSLSFQPAINFQKCTSHLITAEHDDGKCRELGVHKQERFGGVEILSI